MRRNIEEIVDSLPDIPGRKAGGKTHFKRTKKLSKVLSIPGVLIICSMLVMGVLLGHIWVNYSLTIQSDINVTGGTGEMVELYWDDIVLSGTSMELTNMDVQNLNPGDNIRVTHTVSNLNTSSQN